MASSPAPPSRAPTRRRTRRTGRRDGSSHRRRCGHAGAARSAPAAGHRRRREQPLRVGRATRLCHHPAADHGRCCGGSVACLAVRLAAHADRRSGAGACGDRRRAAATAAHPERGDRSRHRAPKLARVRVRRRRPLCLQYALSAVAAGLLRVHQGRPRRHHQKPAAALSRCPRPGRGASDTDSGGAHCAADCAARALFAQRGRYACRGQYRSQTTVSPPASRSGSAWSRTTAARSRCSC